MLVLVVALWVPLRGTGRGGADLWQGLLLAIAIGVTETTALHFEFRRQAFSMSLSEAPVVVGLFFISPPLLLAARLIGAGGGFAIRRTRGRSVVAFNLALFALEIGVAVTVFRASTR